MLRDVVDGVRQVPLGKHDHTNVYLVGDVLVDAGNRKQGSEVLGAVAGQPVSAHLVTHAHPDHAGGSRQVVDALAVPVWASAGDADLVEAGRADLGPSLLRPLLQRAGNTDPVSVARRLSDGDDLAEGFVVLAAPGHTLGHIALWREESSRCDATPGCWRDGIVRQ